MGRPKRAADGGLIYHVLNRGNARMTIFHKGEEKRCQGKRKGARNRFLHWRKEAKRFLAPFLTSIKKSFHPDGNVKTVTTYDQHGNAHRQYGVSERGHDFHQHTYEAKTTKPNPKRESIDTDAPKRSTRETVND